MRGRMEGGIPSTFFIQLAMALLVLVVNVLIMTTVWRSRRLHSRLYLLTANLAAADSVMGLGVFTRLVILVSVEQPSHQSLYVCGPSTLCFVASALWSVSGMVLICLERLLTVAKPTSLQCFLVNLDKYFKPLALSSIAFSVLMAVAGLLVFQPAQAEDVDDYCVIGMPFVHPAYWQTVSLTLAAMSTLFIVCHSYSIYRGRKNIQELQRAFTMRQRPFDRPQGPPSCWLSPKALSCRRDGLGNQDTGTLRGSDAHELRHAIVNMKLTVTMAIVLVLFIVCWSPEIIILFLNNTCPSRCHIETSSITIAGTLAVLNSFINIWIYSLRLREFRRELRRLLPCCRPSHVAPGEKSADVITLMATVARDVSCIQPQGPTRQSSESRDPQTSSGGAPRIDYHKDAHLMTIKPIIISRSQEYDD